MNYPQYTNIIQICFLPDIELAMPEQMYEFVNKLNNGKIYKTVLNSNLCWETIMDLYISICASNHDIPVLHLDTHGGKNVGFVKDPSNPVDIITWDRLVTKITELNQVSNGQLFLSLNICEGLYIYNNLSNNVYPLSLKTIGSFDNVLANEGKIRFTSMYTEYFTSFDMNKAVSTFFSQNPPRKAGRFALI